MKIGIFSDIHANLPALKACMQFFREQNCYLIFHVGDLIGVGPYPRECMDFAASQSGIKYIMGNHDAYYAFGIPDSMREGEKKHQQWTHSQIGDFYRDQVQDWHYSKDLISSGFRFTFRHYGLRYDKNDFKSFAENRTVKELDDLFGDIQSDVVFFGHDHQDFERKGRSHYFCLGSAGLNNRPIARVTTLDIQGDGYKINRHEVPYKDGDMLREYDRRNIPEKDLIREKFLIRK